MGPSIKRYKKCFYENRIITLSQIKAWKYVLNIASVLLIVVAIGSFLSSVKMNSTSLVLIAVASVVLAFLSKKRSQLFDEISIENYATLRSHKTDNRVAKYLDTVHASGRRFIVKLEYETILDYCLVEKPYQEAITKVFSPEDPNERPGDNGSSTQ